MKKLFKNYKPYLIWFFIHTLLYLILNYFNIVNFNTGICLGFISLTCLNTLIFKFDHKNKEV